MTDSKCGAAMAFAVVLVGLCSGCVHEQTHDPEDLKITAKVEALLKQQPNLRPPTLIRVSTRDGVVYLSGEDNTGLEADTAEAIARTVPDVKGVVSTIADVP
jgi:osmotically-inducible protein OsmY